MFRPPHRFSDYRHSLQVMTTRPSGAGAHSGATGHPDRATRSAVSRDRRSAPDRFHNLTGQGLDEEVDPGIESLCSRSCTLEWLIERGVLPVAVVPQPQAEDQPTVGETVEGGRLLCHDLRSTTRKRSHQGPERDVIRGDGYGSQRHPRVGEWLTRAVPEVVPHEEAVPASRFGADGQLGHRDGLGKVGTQ